MILLYAFNDLLISNHIRTGYGTLLYDSFYRLYIIRL